MDTITAISTPIGVGAIGIVRISGAKAKEILKKLWISGQNPVENFVTHRLYYGKLSTIDNVLAVWMAAPNSYTGEDLVEIHCHGGSLIAKTVLEAVLNAGARLAFPGEFTRKAFLNGKFDLAQAEAVCEVINATSERALKLANEQLNGKLSNVVKEVQDKLKEIKAFTEAAIDFPEEDIEFLNHEKSKDKIFAVKEKLSHLSSTYNEGRLIHDGVKVVIVGKPNVGKSSLLNVLLGSERAIVHHKPGTTRDTIEETVIINGIAFHLIDTAGIRNSECEIENIGIGRAKLKISEADVAIVVLDATALFGSEDEAVLHECGDIKKIIVVNKIDLTTTKDDPKRIFISAKTSLGLEKLKTELKNIVYYKNAESEGVVITSLRHKKELDNGIAALLNALIVIEKKESVEFVAHHLQSAMDSLGKITGTVTTEDVLNEIFSKFCIGK